MALDELSQGVDGGRRSASASVGVTPRLRSAPAQPGHSPPVAGAPLPPQAQPAAAREPDRGRLRRLVLLALLLAVLGYGGHLAYDYWTDGRFLVGTDDAYVQVDMTQLAAKVPGYIVSVEVENNQPVRAGDPIARIDDGDYRLALQAAQGKLATQESTIARIGRQIDAAQAEVEREQANLLATHADEVRAQADYQRQNELTRADFASKARFDQAVADRDRSAAAVKGAEAALAVEQANTDVLRAQQVEAQRLAEELRTAVARAERDLSFTTVRAPMDGVVGNKAIQVGSYVQAGTRLAALVPLAEVHIDANFKETQLAHIRPGQTVRLAVDAYGGRALEGRVASIAPASGSVFSLLPPENATGNFTKIVQRVPVRIELPPKLLAEGILRPGLSVVAEVDTRTGPGGPVADEATAAAR